MKKLIAMMMVLVSLMGVNAQAELRYEPYHKEARKVAELHDGTVVWDTYYFAKVVTDYDEKIVEISKEEYEALLEKSDQKSERSFFNKVASVATFWNPND